MRTWNAIMEALPAATCASMCLYLVVYPFGPDPFLMVPAVIWGAGAVVQFIRKYAE